MNKSYRVRLLLAAQVSLLGFISPNIRCIGCDAIGETILVKIIFDGEILDSDREAMDEVGTEIISHFKTEMIDVQCIRIDAPLPLGDEPLGLRVYQRKE